jgi:hypothetical protein
VTALIRSSAPEDAWIVAQFCARGERYCSLNHDKKIHGSVNRDDAFILSRERW